MKHFLALELSSEEVCYAFTFFSSPKYLSNYSIYFACHIGDLCSLPNYYLEDEHHGEMCSGIFEQVKNDLKRNLLFDIFAFILALNVRASRLSNFC